jgi:hypothetical protein
LKNLEGKRQQKSAIVKMIKKFLETGSLLEKNRNRQKSVLTPGISALQ